MVSKPTRCANHIEEVGKEIEKTINQTVQNTLNALERDCDHIAELVRTHGRRRDFSHSLTGNRSFIRFPFSTFLFHPILSLLSLPPAPSTPSFFLLLPSHPFIPPSFPLDVPDDATLLIVPS